MEFQKYSKKKSLSFSWRKRSTNLLTYTIIIDGVVVGIPRIIVGGVHVLLDVSLASCWRRLNCAEDWRWCIHSWLWSLINSRDVSSGGGRWNEGSWNVSVKVSDGAWWCKVSSCQCWRVCVLVIVEILIVDYRSSMR